MTHKAEVHSLSHLSQLHSLWNKIHRHKPLELKMPRDINTLVGLIPEICNSILQKLGCEAFQLVTFSNSEFFDIHSEISGSKMAMSPS